MSDPFDGAAKAAGSKRNCRDNPVHRNKNNACSQGWEKWGVAGDRPAHNGTENYTQHHIKRRAPAHESLITKTNDPDRDKKDHESAKRHLPRAEVLALKPESQRPVNVRPHLVQHELILTFFSII